MKIMKRRYLAQALLIASLGALATTGYAQTNTTADQTPGSPGAAAPEGGTGPAAGTGTYSTPQPGSSPPMSTARIRAYEQARANCDAGPAAERSECWSALTKNYAGIQPMCQKLTGNALDACVHGLDSGSAGSVAK